MPRLLAAILLLLQVQSLSRADTLASLPVHAREGVRPEAIIFVGGRADGQFGWIGTQTYAVLPDGTLEEWRTGIFGFACDFQLSSDRRVMLVNARRDFNPPAGPTSVFTPRAEFVYPPEGYRGPPPGGRLSSDGRRVWFSDTWVSAYDTTSGERVLYLPMPTSPGRTSYPLDPYNSPEFVLRGESECYLADEAAEAMVRLGPVHRWDTPSRGATPHVYPDGRSSQGLVNAWRGPTGTALVLEKMEWLGSYPALRVHTVSPERQREWADASEPPDRQFRSLATWLFDRASTDGDHMTDYGRITGPDRWANDLNNQLQDGRNTIFWSPDGSRAVLSRVVRHSNTRCNLLVSDGGAMTVLPKGYEFVDFTLDGQSLLAVVSREIVDPAAAPEERVLAKIGLDDGKVRWTSQPFVNCRGMVPYPAFDLEEFREGR